MFTNYEIVRIDKTDYEKCNNIWDMKKNPKMTNKWYNELISGNRHIFIYKINSEFIGQGDLLFENSNPELTISGKRVYLSRLIVKTEYQNNGIGSTLIDFLLNYPKSIGYKEISIEVNKENLRALHLYLKKNFVQIYEGKDEFGDFIRLLKII